MTEQSKMTGGTPEVHSDKRLTLLTLDIWFLTFEIWHMAFYIQPTDQYTNGPMDQWTNGPKDNGPMDHWTNGPIVKWSNRLMDQ